LAAYHPDVTLIGLWTKAAYNKESVNVKLVSREADSITKIPTSPPKKTYFIFLAYLILITTFSCTMDNDEHQVMAITRMTF
jgi:hypothetical protein